MRRQIVVDHIKLAEEQESVELQSEQDDDDEQESALGKDAFPRGRFSELSAARAASAGLEVTDSVDNQSVQGGRKAFADIAYSTVSGPGVIHKNNAQFDDFKLTVGSMGITQGETISVDQPTIDGAGTTHPNISQALMTNMMHMHKTTSPIIAAIQIVEKDHQEASAARINQQNLAFQKQPSGHLSFASSSMKKKQMTNRAQSELTKAEVSLTNTEEIESLSKETRNFDPRVASNSALATAHHAMIKRPVEGADKVQLPFLGRGPARNEANSSALLHLQHSNNSLTQEMQLMNANMQSQSPLRSIGLDFDTNGKLLKNSGTGGAGFFAKQAGGMNQTMPPLKSQIMTESLLSSKQQLKGRGSRLESPVGAQLVQMTTSTPKTPGQNWERRAVAARPEISVQEFLQMQKLNQCNEVLDQSQIFGKFAVKDIIRENKKRISKQPLANQSQNAQAVRDYNSKTPFLRDVTDQLFDTCKTPSKGKAVFGERSKSVLSPTTLTAYTPLAKKPLIAADSRTHIHKRHSSVLNRGSLGAAKPKEVRQLGFIKPAIPEGLLPNQTGPGVASPHIKTPTSNVIIKNNDEVELKKIIGGFVGQNRFEDGQQSVSLPSKAFEQWLDALLKAEEIRPTELPAASRGQHSMEKMKQADSQASKASIIEEFGKGLDKCSKVSDTKPASLRYGLDYQSLAQNGLSKEQITRLHRSIYVHTHGFYNTVKDVCSTAKNKKNVVVSVMKVYQQLLERCHQQEWKMLINEVANAFEDEDLLKQKQMKSLQDDKETTIANLQRQIKSLQDVIDARAREIDTQKESFQRLNETYLIMQHHNEQSLTLRLMTEERLKALFQRDRDQNEITRQLEVDHKNDQECIKENDEKIDNLETKLGEVYGTLKDKEGMHRLIQAELQAQKRNYLQCKDKLSQIEGPYLSMQEQQNQLQSLADNNANDSKNAILKMHVLESQVNPLVAQVKLLTSENSSLKQTNNTMEFANARMSKSMHAALKELADRTRTFFTAEEQLREKNKLLQKLEANLKSTTTRMLAYELESKNLDMRMFHADEKLRQMTIANTNLSGMIQKLDKHENKREKELIDERRRNDRMKEELFDAEEKLNMAKTTTLFVMQNNINDSGITINKLQTELSNLFVSREQDKKFHKDEKQRMHKQIEKLDKLNKNYRAEIKKNTVSESKYRQKYKLIADKFSMLQIEVSTLNNGVTTFDETKIEYKATIMELYAEITELKATILMHENLLIEKKAKQKAFKAQRFEGQRLVHEELDKAEDRQKEAIDANIMQGEDYRSQALTSYHKVLELKEIICYLKGEPEVHKARFLALLSQLRRDTERHKMIEEDHRQEIMRLYRVIEGKDQLLARQDLRHAEDQYLVQVMRNKLAIDDFDIAHVSTQSSPVCSNIVTQTENVQSHVAVQAFAYKLRNTQQQTDDHIPSYQFSEERDSPVQMPVKKLIKKKGKKGKKLDHNESQSSIKRLDAKSNQGSPTKITSGRKGSLVSQKSSVGSGSIINNATAAPKGTTRAQSISPSRTTTGGQSFWMIPPQRIETNLQQQALTTQNSPKLAKKLQRDGAATTTNSGTELVSTPQLQTGNFMNSVEEVSETTGAMMPKVSQNDAPATSLSNPAKFKLENKHGVPEDLAKKSVVRQGVFWQMSVGQAGKQGGEQARKKQQTALRAQQMRGLIRSAVNRDLD